MSEPRTVRYGRRSGADVPRPSPRQPEFTLALKPGTKPDEIDKHRLHKAVESEYITKYLESIGAAPTKANMDYVRKLAPLTKDNVKPKLKAKGHMRDEIAVTAPEAKADFVMPTGVPRKSMLVMGMVNNVADVPEGEEEVVMKPWGATTKAGVKEVVAERGEEPHFADMTSKFIFPFNLKLEGARVIKEHARSKLAQMEAQSKATAALRMERATAATEDNRECSPSRSSSPDGRWSATSRSPSWLQSPSSAGAAIFDSEPGPSSEALKDERSGRLINNEDLEAEMAGVFEVTPEVVLALQSDFENGILEWRQTVSRHTMGRVSDADFEATISALSSDLVLHLFGTVVSYMYDEYVNPTRRDGEETESEAGEWSELQRERVFTMHKQFATVTKHHRASRTRLFFTLPILILSMRTCVECLFREVFPLWTSTMDGMRALRLMQDSITELFDPHGYYSNLSILQSAPAAVRIMDSYKRLAHSHARHHFSDTSPLVKAALNGSKASATRRMLYKQSQRPERINSQVSEEPELEPDQKCRLMEMARAMPAQARDLRQIGRHQLTDRAGWLHRPDPATQHWSSK